MYRDRDLYFCTQIQVSIDLADHNSMTRRNRKPTEREGENNNDGSTVESIGKKKNGDRFLPLVTLTERIVVE